MSLSTKIYVYGLRIQSLQVGFARSLGPIFLISPYMRPRVDWMTQGDERILEFLYEKEIIASPSVIAANIDYTNEYVSRRCRELTNGELLQRVDASNYRLTELGKRFLEGNVDAEELHLDEN